MDRGELVSIVMPAHNAEKTIRQAIDSVLHQTYPNWELLVIDDSSSDATLSIAQKYSLSDSRIMFFSNPQNRGVSETRNRGITNAAGEWIAFLDSDDMWAEDKLEKQIGLTHKKTCRGEVPDLVFTGSAFIDRLGKQADYQLEVPESISYHELLKQNVISCSSVLVRRELVLKFPMKRDDMHEDYAVWLQILKNGGHAYGINEPLLLYRLSESSKSANKRKAALMTWKVYRFMGLNPLQSIYYFNWYTCRNLRKYFKISRSRSRDKTV